MVFLLLVIISIITNNCIRRVFSECTEAIATSLVPLDINFAEICAFIIGFSCIVFFSFTSKWVFCYLFPYFFLLTVAELSIRGTQVTIWIIMTKEN